MRMRLGLLRDTAQIERQAAKEAAAEAAKKHKPSAPTVKTEAQTKAEQEEVAKAAKEKTKATTHPRIRPLSEAKAIESGANFISEGFLFAVGGGLIIFESLRSRRKETSRREDVATRINELEDAVKIERRASVDLEREILRLRAKLEPGATSPKHLIPRQVWQLEQKEEEEAEKRSSSWLQRIGSYIQFRRSDAELAAENAPLGTSVSDHVLQRVLSKNQLPVTNEALENEKQK